MSQNDESIRTNGCRRPPVRMLVLALTTAAYMVQMGLRVSLSVAIVAMVNHTAIPHTQTPAYLTCGYNHSLPPSVTDAELPQSNGTSPADQLKIEDGETPSDDAEDGEFVWNEVEQGSFLSAFYWGYFLSQVPGGYLAERYGSKRVIGASQSLNGLLMLLLPTAAGWGIGYAMMIRVLQGIVCGPIYPCLFPLVARWFPLDEHHMAIGIVNAFTAFGISIMTSLAGQISASLGWRAVFYFSGASALVWAVAWFSLVYDTPMEHPFANEDECKLIGAGNVTKSRTTKRPPYLAMLKSAPVLAIVLAETANSWALTYLMTSLPTYMKNVLHFDIKSNGIVSGLPLLGRGLTFFVAGFAGDLAARRGWLRVNTIRRAAAALVGSEGLLLLLVTFVGCQPAVATLCFVLAGFLNGFIGTGHLINALDIAPNYSASVFSIANTVGNGVSILNPIVTGAMIEGEQTMEKWNQVFYLGAAVFLVSFILYQPMMSTERQWWDRQEDDEQPDDDQADTSVKTLEMQ